MKKVCPCRVGLLLPCLLSYFFAILLSGCGTYYRVSVDSLNAASADARQYPYCLKPGDDHVSEDDLLFRDVARTLAPAFSAQGYEVVLPEAVAVRTSPAKSGSGRGAASGKEPCIEARIEYWKEDPRTSLHHDTVQRSHPVRIRDGKRKERIEYVTVEEPVVTVVTTYGASLLVTAVDVSSGGKERQLWRTAVTSTGPVDSFRTLLQAMIPALEISLGTQSRGERFFEVFVNDEGGMSLSEL